MDARIIDFIEGMYSRTLADKEILVLKDLLENETLETFKSKYEYTLTKKVDYFTPAKMKQLVKEQLDIEAWLNSVGLKSLNELYEN